MFNEERSERLQSDSQRPATGRRRVAWLENLQKAPE